MKDRRLQVVVFLFSAALAGCSGQSALSVPGNDLKPQSGPALRAPTLRQPMDTYGGITGTVTGTLNTLLGDSAPTINGKPLEHFYIGVREIDAIANGQVTTLGTSTPSYQLDLLQYQNGSTDWMTQTSVAQQTYTQLRFVLDTASAQAVFTDGTTMPVQFESVASVSTSGIGASTSTAADQSNAGAVDVTVNLPFSVQSNLSSVAGDFNLFESVTSGSGVVTVRPTIALASGAAQISGTVVNKWGAAVQNAVVAAVGSNGAVANTASTDANGNFNVHALNADTYQLVVYNRYTTAAGQNIQASGQSWGYQSVNGPSISVTSGSSVSAGSIGD